MLRLHRQLKKRESEEIVYFGALYDDGISVPQNMYEAIKW